MHSEPAMHMGVPREREASLACLLRNTLPSCRVGELLYRQDARLPCCSVPQLHGCPKACLPGCPVSLPSCQIGQLRNCQDTWLPGCLIDMVAQLLYCSVACCTDAQLLSCLDVGHSISSCSVAQQPSCLVDGWLGCLVASCWFLSLLVVQ